MEGKTIAGCVYCGRVDVEVGTCCRRHVRLVCAECVETRAFLREHEPVAATA